VGFRRWVFIASPASVSWSVPFDQLVELFASTSVMGSWIGDAPCADLYVHPEITAGEREEKLAGLTARYAKAGYGVIGVAAGMKKWAEQYAPYIPEEHRAKCNRRPVRAWLETV
jgi:hypothetical protein